MGKQKIHYGWVIVGCCFLITMFIQLATNTWSYFQLPICTELGCTYVQYSMTNVLSTVASMIFGLTMATRMAKGNLRMYMLVGGLVGAAGWFVQGYATQIWQICITFFVITFALSTMFYVPINILMTNWFVDKKALALSLSLMGSGVGQMLFSKLISGYISTQGWRSLSQLYGVVAAVTTVVVFLFIRKSPADKGLEPYRQAKAADNATTAAPGQRLWMGLTKGEALKTPTFALLAVIVICAGMLASGVMSQIPTYLTESGLPYANAMVVYSVFMIVNKITIGPFFDKGGVTRGVTLCAVLLVGAFAGLLMVPTGAVWAYAAMALVGLGMAVASLGPALLVSNLFGVKEYGGIYGVVNFFFYAGCMAGPMMTSGIRTATGSYSLAWIIYIAITVLMLVCTFIAIRSGTKLKERYPA